MTWAWQNQEDVPGATCTSRCAETGTVWSKMIGDLECLAISGAHLWRAMVVGPPLPEGTVLYITHHEFEGPCDAMADAEKRVRRSQP